jgi:Family of unknown function (DUF5681)
MGWEDFMEIDGKIGAESLPKNHSQEHTPAEPPGDAPAEAHAPSRTPPEGRRWIKGQSGNPRGRPSRAHKAAYVAHAMLDDKTIQLLDKVIGWGQGSDKSMLRLYTQKMVPPRQEVPVWLNVPPIQNCADLRAAMKAVATGVAQGDIASAQGLRLVRLFSEIYRYL